MMTIKEVKKIFYDQLAGLTNQPGISGSNPETPLNRHVECFRFQTIYLYFSTYIVISEYSYK